MSLALLASAWTFFRISGSVFNPNVAIALAMTGALKPMWVNHFTFGQRSLAPNNCTFETYHHLDSLQPFLPLRGCWGNLTDKWSVNFISWHCPLLRSWPASPPLQF
jgi:hypothetical protein